jgi:small subunit ribosomal protein S7
LDKLSQNGEKGIDIFKKAIDNVSPTIGTKMKRIGGTVIQIPSEIRKEKQISLAMKWIIEIARKRSEKTMVDKLYKEITDAYNNEGGAIKKKTDKQKMASSNKVFATLNF